MGRRVICRAVIGFELIYCVSEEGPSALVEARAPLQASSNQCFPCERDVSSAPAWFTNGRTWCWPSVVCRRAAGGKARLRVPTAHALRGDTAFGGEVAHSPALPTTGHSTLSLYTVPAVPRYTVRRASH